MTDFGQMVAVMGHVALSVGAAWILGAVVMAWSKARGEGSN